MMNNPYNKWLNNNNNNNKEWEKDCKSFLISLHLQQLF